MKAKLLRLLFVMGKNLLVIFIQNMPYYFTVCGSKFLCHHLADKIPLAVCPFAYLL
jgi:hypothetical protein